MYFIDPLHSAQSAIIESLALETGLTMHELSEKVRKNYGIEIPTATLYRLVSQLIEKQMLVREKGKHSLNLVWIKHFLKVASEVEDIYITQQKQTVTLPTKEGERKTYAAGSFRELEPLINHVLLQLEQSAQDSHWYEYASHPYFALSMPDTEIGLYESISAKGILVHMLHGNDTFLDKYGVKWIKKMLPKVKTDAIHDSPFLKEGYYLVVYGPFVVECFLPEMINKHFEAFFKRVHSIEQFDPQMFDDVFRMKAKCNMTLRMSSSDADLLRSKFEMQWKNHNEMGSGHSPL